MASFAGLVTICSSPSISEAGYVVSVLESEGVPAFIPDAFSVLDLGCMEFPVQVHSADAELAAEVLREVGILSPVAERQDEDLPAWARYTSPATALVYLVVGVVVAFAIAAVVDWRSPRLRMHGNGPFLEDASHRR